MLTRWLGAVVCGVAVAVMTPSAGWASEIEFGWSGTVSSVDPGLAAALPPGSGIEPGANAFVAFVFESTTPDADPDPKRGDYQGALLSWRLQVGSFVFTRDPSGSRNQIEILLDPLLTVYEPASSVIATPALPGLSTVESDVFFLSLQPDALPTDALPLSPLEPTDWDEAAAGILDPTTGEPVIDIELTAICVGACQPHAGPPLGSRRFEASLILHDFTTLFRDFFTLMEPSPFVALPLGANCDDFFGCGAATLTQGAPLTGSGTASASGSSPAMFTLPGGGLRASATGWLPAYLPPFDYARTAVTASNEAGSFYAGGGPGNRIYTPLYPRANIQAGPNQFGGVMRLLGSMRSTRRHLNPYEEGGFLGAESGLFSALGGTCDPGAAMCTPANASLAYGNFTYQHEVLTTSTTMAFRYAHGWAWTTGTVTVRATNGNGYPITLQRKGYDNRTPFGAYGTIQLVAPQVARWEFANRSAAPWDRESATIGVLKIKFVPEPSAWLLLAAGAGVLVLLRRVSRRG